MNVCLEVGRREEEKVRRSGGYVINDRSEKLLPRSEPTAHGSLSKQMVTWSREL